MDAASVGLVVVVVAFAVVNGANDGSTLVAVGLKLAPALLPGVLGLAAAVLVVPLVLGTGVATTYAVRLVDGSAGGEAVFAAAAVAAVVAVGALARAGLPTSLTLGLVAGLSGAGLAAGRDVSWSTLAAVLAVAAAAPLAAGLVAGGLRYLAVALGGVGGSGGAARVLRRLHGAGFVVLAVTYGANDGQKMLAVAAVAFGHVDGSVDAVPAMLLAVAVLFALGTSAGLARVGPTLDRGLLATRPAHAVGAELAGGSVVLLSALAGAPVSMTQAVAGGLVGAGAASGAPRVRWRAVARLAGAWVCTVPAAFALGAGLAGLGRWL